MIQTPSVTGKEPHLIPAPDTPTEIRVDERHGRERTLAFYALSVPSGAGHLVDAGTSHTD